MIISDPRLCGQSPPPPPLHDGLLVGAVRLALAGEMQMRPPCYLPSRFPPPFSLVDKWRPSLGRQISTNKTRLTGRVTTIFKINRHSCTVRLSVRLGPNRSSFSSGLPGRISDVTRFFSP